MSRVDYESDCHDKTYSDGYRKDDHRSSPWSHVSAPTSRRITTRVLRTIGGKAPSLSNYLECRYWTSRHAKCPMIQNPAAAHSNQKEAVRSLGTTACSETPWDPAVK